MSGMSLDISTVGLYCRSLAKAGVLEVIKRSPATGGPRPFYRIVKDSLEAPRVRKDGSIVTQGRGRKNLWRSMKILPTFDLALLVGTSRTEEHPISWEEAETYLRCLEKAGYVRRLNRKDLPAATFKLVRYTGPRPPMIQRIKQIWDPNLKKVMWRPKGGDE
jgi:hypothetical protein